MNHFVSFSNMLNKITMYKGRIQNYGFKTRTQTTYISLLYTLNTVLVKIRNLNLTGKTIIND